MNHFGSPSLRSRNPAVRTSFILFVFIIFLYSIGDAIMSFMAPNILEDIVKNPLMIGIVISFSSFVGFFIDFFLSNLIRERSFFVYSFVGITVAIIFPLILLGEQNIVTAIISMAIWGIYFELLAFSQSNYIHHFLTHDQHDIGWSVLNAFSNAGYIIGPTLTLLITSFGEDIPLQAAIVIQCLAIIGLLTFKLVFAKESETTYVLPLKNTSIFTGITVWKVLYSKLFPVLFYYSILVTLSSTFWTVGATLIHDIRQTNQIADLFYLIHLLPAFIVAPIGIKISRIIGKKRTAYIAGIMSGSTLGISILFSEFEVFLILIGIASSFYFIALPEIRGAIEDYCERLGHNSNTLVGLVSSMASIAYIVGPIISGAIASVFGSQKAFAIMGLILTLISIIFLIITPRKIRLPQQAIATANEN